MDLKRYKRMTNVIVGELIDFDATYGECLEVLDGVKRQIENKVLNTKIDEVDGE